MADPEEDPLYRLDIPGLTTATATTTSSVVLAANLARRGATVYNEGPSAAYLALAPAASLVAYTIQVASGGYYEVPYGHTAELAAITSIGTAVLRVTELT